MKILRVKKLPLYDVFTGDGWYNWSRIVKNNDTLKIISGNQLSSAEKFYIQQYVKEQENV